MLRTAIAGKLRAIGRPVYEAALFLFGGGTAAWEMNGETFRIDPRYRREVGHKPEALVSSLLSARVAPGSICVEVGAHLGVHVLQMARRVGPTGRVVAFEPNPRSLALLKRHVDSNGYADRVTIVSAAVGGADGRGVLHTQGVDQRARLGSPNAGLSGRIEHLDVEVISLDSWTTAHGVAPDWLVIDVEGFEEGVLQGAERLIASRPEMVVIVEMHPDAWSDAGTTRASLGALLARLGRRAVSVEGGDPFAGYNHAVLEPVPLV